MTVTIEPIPGDESGDEMALFVPGAKPLYVKSRDNFAGLVVSKAILHAIGQAVKKYQKQFHRYRRKGKICPVCKREVDDRADGCKEHPGGRAKSEATRDTD